jgi:hypothetical protein
MHWIHYINPCVFRKPDIWNSSSIIIWDLRKAFSRWNLFNYLVASNFRLHCWKRAKKPQRITQAIPPYDSLTSSVPSRLFRIKLELLLRVWALQYDVSSVFPPPIHFINSGRSYRSQLEKQPLPWLWIPCSNNSLHFPSHLSNFLPSHPLAVLCKSLSNSSNTLW